MKTQFLHPIILMLSLCFFSFTEKENWDQDLQNKMNQFADSLSNNLKEWKVPNKTFKIENYGAIPDGKTINTDAIQQAINACSKSGGGYVLFSKGDYVTGTIDLKSWVMLKIKKGASILGSTNLKDYPDRIAKRKTVMDTHMDIRNSLIYAENVNKVGICGGGTIDFRGTRENFPGKETTAELPGRPFGMRFIDSENIVVKDINLRNSASWMQDYLHCKRCIFKNINNENQSNYNEDGMDLDGCQYVIVQNCYFNSYDDAMCLKGASLKPTQDILIENSTFYSKCNSLKIGTDTQGDFRRIIARNLVLGAPPVGYHYFLEPNATESGITVVTVDGGIVEDIIISNVEINRTSAPIFLRVGDRGRLMPGMPKAPIGKLRRIVIEKVSGKDNLKQGSFISGIENGIIKDIVIKDMNISMVGGINYTPKYVKENISGYPDAHRFENPLPSYGFYIRHAENIKIDNVNIHPNNKDVRPIFSNGGDIKNVIVNGKALD